MGEICPIYFVFLFSQFILDSSGLNNIIIDDKIFIGAQRTKVNNIKPGAVYVYTPEPLSVKENNTLEPEEFFISQNYPNPFNPTTSIQYAIGNRQFVTIKVYDVLGNEVGILVNEEKPAGEYEVTFNSSGLASGVYVYKLTSGNFSESKKLILLK